MSEVEKRHRINVALWAYAYEVMDDPIVSDEVFDRACKGIDPAVSTDNERLDTFFRDEFNPSTGVWIYKHPDTEGLRQIYSRLSGKIGKAVTPENKGQNGGAVIKPPFNSHFENMLYLAYLGFRIVPGFFNGFEYWVEDDILYLKRDGEEKNFFLKDLFDRNLTSEGDSNG